LPPTWFSQQPTLCTLIVLAFKLDYLLHGQILTKLLQLRLSEKAGIILTFDQLWTNPEFFQRPQIMSTYILIFTINFSNIFVTMEDRVTFYWSNAKIFGHIKTTIFFPQVWRNIPSFTFRIVCALPEAFLLAASIRSVSRLWAGQLEVQSTCVVVPWTPARVENT
jgi:hypothetical protein